MLKLIAENVIDDRITEGAYGGNKNLYHAKPCMAETIKLVKDIFDLLTKSFESTEKIVDLNSFEIYLIDTFIATFIPPVNRVNLYYVQNNSLTGKNLMLGMNLMVHMQREFTFSLAPLYSKGQSDSVNIYFIFSAQLENFITEIDVKVFARTTIEEQLFSSCMSKAPGDYPRPKL